MRYLCGSVPTRLKIRMSRLNRYVLLESFSGTSLRTSCGSLRNKRGEA